MDEDGSAITAMGAITISREYGSGGGEVAARLAKRLGWQLIDHEVVVRVAEMLQVSEEEAEEHDECVERLAYVMSREGLAREAAQARILKKDQERARYLERFYHRHPGDPHLYDLVLNTGILDLESAAEVISIVLERKARRLSVPMQELGPAVGLSHYPGQPEDFRPPQE